MARGTELGSMVAADWLLTRVRVEARASSTVGSIVVDASGV